MAAHHAIVLSIRSCTRPLIPVKGFFAQPPNKVYFGASRERSCGTGASAKAGMLAAIFMLAGALVHSSRPQRFICGHATGETGVSRAAPVASPRRSIAGGRQVPRSR